MRVRERRPRERNVVDSPTALISGASRGIGRATAERLAREGYAIGVNYRRNEEAARDVVSTIESAGGRAIALRADLEDAEAIDRMFDVIEERFGRLDIFVANAAATSFRSLLETDDTHVQRTFSITVTGFLRCVRRTVPLMEELGGAIIAVSGLDSIRAIDRHGNLGAAKSAMETLVRYLAVELAPRKIRVNGVNPGYIETDSSRFYGGAEYETAVEKWISQTPAGRLGRPEEIANVIAFLCSEEASFLYGQTVIVDGGLTLW